MARSFRRVTANARESQSTTIGNFGGVDLSNPTLQVNSARAVDSLNFIKKDRLNQKRNGIHQMADLPEEVHGIWTFDDAIAEERIIMHMGTSLYLVTGFANGNNEDDFDYTKISGDLVFKSEEGYRSVAWAAGERLYVLAGIYAFVYYDVETQSLVVENLENNEQWTFEPLTTTSIGPDSSTLVGDQRQAFDDVNMLTQWRTNKLITGGFLAVGDNEYNASGFTRYTLDTNVVAKTPSDLENVEVNIKYQIADAAALVNPEFSEAVGWVSNDIYSTTFLPDDISFNGYVFEKNAYTSANNEFHYLGIATKIRYSVIYGGSKVFSETPLVKALATSPGTIITSTSNTTPFENIVVNETNQFVIDYRPALTTGHLSGFSSGDGLFDVSVPSGQPNYFEIRVKAFVEVRSAFNGALLGTKILEETIQVPIQSSIEYSEYRINQEITRYGYNITTSQCDIANTDGTGKIGTLYFGDEDTPAHFDLLYLGGAEYINPVPGTNNVTIRFPHYVPDYIERITGCTLGKLWGYNGARNRLFISGNPGYKNLVWHSTSTNFYSRREETEIVDSNQDFTYFSDLDYNVVGTESNSVVGMEVTADGRLVVLKSDSNQDSTIFTFKASLTNAFAFDGSAVLAPDGFTNLQEELYTSDVGNIGDGAINPFAVATLNGDTMFLSKAGVRGIILQENLPVEQRKSFPRSTLINKRILEDKSTFDSSFMYVFNGYMYLYVNGFYYVCSEDYTNNDLDNREYEWWILKGFELDGVYQPIESKFMWDYDGELYIISQYGISKFVENNYVDIFFEKFGNGNAIHGDVDTTIDLNDSIRNLYNVANATDVLFPVGNHYARLAQKDFTTYATNSTIGITNLTMYEEYTVYLDNIYNVTFLSENTPYTLRLAGTQLYLADESGSYIRLPANATPPSTWGFRVSFIIPGKLKIKERNTSNDNVVLMDEFDREVELMYYDGNVPDFSIIFYNQRNVVSYYITSPFNFGINTNNKTIERFILSNDTRLDSYIEISYLASNKSDYFRDILGKYANDQVDLTETSLNNLYLGSTYLPLPYTIRANLRNVSSIMFKFYNNDDNNSCLTNLTMLYYVTRKLR